MAINLEDGDFGLDCWEDPEGEGEPYAEFSDDRSELEQRAVALIEEGKFQFIVLSAWNEDTEAWDAIEEYESEDVDA